MKITDYIKAICPFCNNEIIIETNWGYCYYEICRCNKCAAYGTAWSDHRNMEWKSTKTSTYINLDIDAYKKEKHELS